MDIDIALTVSLAPLTVYFLNRPRRLLSYPPTTVQLRDAGEVRGAIAECDPHWAVQEPFVETTREHCGDL